VPTPARTIDKALARALRALREDRGLSQEATAQRAGITLNSYARIELAQASPAWSTVRSIADALGVSLSELAVTVEAKR
jgi:transcriptional regulator with XRE-family HTH domain